MKVFPLFFKLISSYKIFFSLQNNNAVSNFTILLLIYIFIRNITFLFLYQFYCLKAEQFDFPFYLNLFHLNKFRHCEKKLNL